jgi:hypothetical protein
MASISQYVFYSGNIWFGNQKSFDIFPLYVSMKVVLINTLRYLNVGYLPNDMPNNTVPMSLLILRIITRAFTSPKLRRSFQVFPSTFIVPVPCSVSLTTPPPLFFPFVHEVAVHPGFVGGMDPELDGFGNFYRPERDLLLIGTLLEQPDPKFTKLFPPSPLFLAVTGPVRPDRGPHAEGDRLPGEVWQLRGSTLQD